MGMIDGTWYWEPSDNFEADVGLGSISITGLYGTGGLAGTNGYANMSATFGSGPFSITGSGVIDRLGSISGGTISDVSLQARVFDGIGITVSIKVGYGLDGPYMKISVNGTEFASYDAAELAQRGVFNIIGTDFPTLPEAAIRASLSDLEAVEDKFGSINADFLNENFEVLYAKAKIELDKDWPLQIENYCFLAGTPILLPDGSTRPIEDVTPGDTVLSYDAAGVLVPGRVVRVFRKEVEHLLDVHGLKVTPGHVTLCGDGMFAGRHVPIIDILLSDGALVTAGGALVRMATNAPVGSCADAMVKVAVALTAADLAAGRLTEAEMRAGTLLFDRDGAAVSVLDCLGAGGYAFNPATGLVATPGEDPHPLHWFGPVPRPEDYILRRSRETLEGILTGGEWEGDAPALVAARLRQISGMRVN